MNMEIKRILYTTDLSQNSRFSFKGAMTLAQKFDARIVVLHVVEDMEPYRIAFAPGDTIRRHYEDLKKDDFEKIREQIQSLCKEDFSGDPTCSGRIATIEVHEGYPAEEILQRAEDLACDAIVMGTHSKKGMTHTFLGSVAERVLRRVRIPVFIIPTPKQS